LKTFRQALQGAGFSVTAEIDAGNRASADEVLQQAAVLAGAVDAIQLGIEPATGIGISHLALATLLLRQGIDPIPRLNCRDRNRIALQSDLLGLRAIGAGSLIINRGSSFPGESDPATKAVFDVRCRELVAMVQELNEEDWPGDPHEFIIGTETTAATNEADWNSEPLLARAAAGARFLQIRPCPDLDLLHRYMKWLVESRATWNYSVMVSLAPFGPGQEGIDRCAETMRAIAEIPGVSGINLQVDANSEAVVSAIASSGLR
jgi:methylenetetrahydrofolate reductase (NADPH)